MRYLGHCYCYTKFQKFNGLREKKLGFRFFVQPSDTENISYMRYAMHICITYNTKI